MLTLIEKKSGKVAAQEKFSRMLRADWKKQGKRLVVWRPNSAELNISHNGKYWFYSDDPDSTQRIQRYWNTFGIYAPQGNLQITVEINIPTQSNTRRVSGFFAFDDETKITYLMHDGGVGGGRKGIGRSAFLPWSYKEPILVRESNDGIRLGILIAPLLRGKVGPRVAHFVEKVANFKKAVMRGELQGEQFQKSMRTYAEYRREFSGRKNGCRSREFEYFSRHGDIVEALRQWRSRSNKEPIGNDAFRDFFVVSRDGRRLKELYEVKTDAKRQTLYTAIGQLTVHRTGGNTGLRRFLVIPQGAALGGDITSALKRESINVLRFSIHKEKVKIHD